MKILFLKEKGYTYFKGVRIEHYNKYGSIDDIPEFDCEPTKGLEILEDYGDVKVCEDNEAIKEFLNEGTNNQGADDGGEEIKEDEEEIEEEATETKQEESEEEAEEDDQITIEEIQKMTVREKKDFCKENDLSGYSTYTKSAELEEFIIEELGL